MGTMVMPERQTFWNGRRPEFNATRSDDRKILSVAAGERERQTIFFSMHMFIFESHSPPAFLQSASVLAFDTSPAKAGPVKARATAITNMDVRVFIGLDPYAGASPVRQRPLWIFCSGNAQTTRRVSWAGSFRLHDWLHPNPRGGI